eukprot:CAMPEP_0198267476 /NCGR_PEP_ID=MMETSP1447-20131203/33278_1 /TAXON_ID=420782 /ORGANISM="Chaetoceros dichaeta, Strain CCMP1751" /LENGTH=72 /DNA_ID=CAMNT_0043958099 /DNA_START=1 /DNA_END=215 /DNA_ORIENTATION=+
MNSSIQSVRGTISARGRSYVYIPSPEYATHSIEEEESEVNDENDSSNEEAVRYSLFGGNGDDNETFDEEAVP